MRATISKIDGESARILNIIGLQKHQTSSSEILRRVLNNAYVILHQSRKQEFFLRIASRICGGGQGPFKEISSDDYSGMDSSHHNHDNSYDQTKAKRLENPDSEEEKSLNKELTASSDKIDLVPGFHDLDHSQNVNDTHSRSHSFGTAVEIATHIGLEFVSHKASLVAGLLHTSELNPGENEWVTQQLLQQEGHNLAIPQNEIEDNVTISSSKEDSD